MFPCPYCANFVTRTFKKLLSHIRFTHSHEPNFSITCGDCGKTYRKFTSFKTHLHREEKKRRLQGLVVEVLAGHAEEPEGGEEDDQDSSDGNFDEELEEAGNAIGNMTRFLALFMMKTKEENQLSQQTLNAIIENTEDVVDESLKVLKDNIKSCMRDSGIDIEEVQGLRDVFEQPSAYSKAKEPLANEYQQVRYFMEHFNYVVSH